MTGFRDESGEVKLFVNDYIRRGSLISLFVIFIIVSVVVAGKRGITSFLGMLITFVLIFSFVLPKISTGSGALGVIILFSLIAIPVTFYLSHGINKKTTVAIVGTCFALILTGVLSAIYVSAAKLTGFTSDESSFLQIMKGSEFNMRGILLAGVIVGVWGFWMI